MVFYRDRQFTNLASSVSLFAVTIGLVVGQSATQKSLAQFSNTPPAPPATLSINGSGASTLNTLFVGSYTGTPPVQNLSCPFGAKGSWFNVYGVGNPPSLNTDVTTPGSDNCPVGTYGPVLPTTTFRYAPVGSGAGITAFFTQTPPSVPAGTPASNNLTILPPVSFGGTDDPLTGTDIERTVTGSPNSQKAVQVPVIGVGITLSYNRNGLTIPAAGLKLSRKSYCGILNGNITNWNDAGIKADNGGAILTTNLPLKVVRRSDSSGSTFVLSTHLNTACQTAATPVLPTTYVWKRGVGPNSLPVPPAPTPPALYSNPPYTPACTLPAPANSVCWPNTFIGTSGGGNVAKVIAATSGAIGYVDSATRLSNSLPAALLLNKSGAYVGPTIAGIQAALGGGTIVKYGTAPNNRLIRIDGLADPTVSTAYPISTATYMLFYDVYENTSIASGIRSFISWALADATGTPPTQPTPPAPNSSNPTPDTIAINRGYAPLPNSIKAVSRTVVNTCVNTVYGPSPCTP